MKTFYSAIDIGDLASQGVYELAVDADTVLTSVARETAVQLGVKLVSPGQSSSAKSALPTTSIATPLKPRGCQHSLAGSGQRQVSQVKRGTGGNPSPIVNDLIGAVKQLAERG